MAEILRSCHICLNDQNMETLLQPRYVWDKYVEAENSRINFFMEVELESVLNKDSTFESEANVLNHNVELRINYKNTNSYSVFFFALHDIFIVINPETG